MGRLSKFNVNEEAFTPEGRDGEVFTLVCIPEAAFHAVLEAMASGNFEYRNQLLFQRGISSISGLEDAEGRDIKNGAGLWLALRQSGAEVGGWIDALLGKIIEKNIPDSDVKGEVGKNLVS